MFASIKKVSVIIFICAVVLFAVLAILAVWQVFDGEVLAKAFGSLATISVALLLIIGAINLRLSGNVANRNKPVSVGWAILYVILGVMAIGWISRLMSMMMYSRW